MPQLRLRLSLLLHVSECLSLGFFGPCDEVATDPGCTPPQTPNGSTPALPRTQKSGRKWMDGSFGLECRLRKVHVDALMSSLLHDLTEILLFKKAIFFLMTNNERIFKRYQIVAQTCHLHCFERD